MRDSELKASNAARERATAASPAELTASTMDVARQGASRRSGRRLDRGASIGRYLILDELGAGGMGVVYKAFDPELGRPIALKLLNSEDEDSDAFRERLLREAQALGRLSHPNVVGVHDVGAFGRSVFIAMEFVEGETLRRWLNAEPRSRRTILDAFVAAGEGLTAAHRAGLVHRDFKPDNVIVGRDGRVRVLDFGLAREAKVDGVVAVASPSNGAAGASEAAAATADEPVVPSDLVVTPRHDSRAPTSGSALIDSRSPSLSSQSGSTPNRFSKMLTVAGSVLGTPRYMAPEQHLSDNVDERADQFSFCVSLYEALYRVPPFAGENQVALRENVLQGRITEPPATAGVPRWLQKVLVRGLAVNPAERYPSMAELLTALRTDPAASRRRWLPTAGVLAVTAMAIVAVRAEYKQQRRICAGAEQRLLGIWDAPRRDAVRTAFRRSGVPYAEAALRTIESAFDLYARRWTVMHTEACAATHVRGEQSQELLDLRMSCLADRLTQLKTLADVYASADAKVVLRATESAQSLDGIDGCADIAALRSPVPLPDNPETHRQVNEVREELARTKALRLAGNFDEGLALAKHALARAQALHYRPIEAEAELQVSNLEGAHGDHRAAAQAAHRAFVAAIAGHHEEIVGWAAAKLVDSLGDYQARYEEADQWAEVVRASLERLPGSDELRGAFYMSLAELRKDEGRYDDALEGGKIALEVQTRAFGEADHRVAHAYALLGSIYAYRRQYTDALKNAERGRAILERALGADHPDLHLVWNTMSAIHAEVGQLDLALGEEERAIALVERAAPNHPNVAWLEGNMGLYLFLLGRAREALPHAERAVALATSADEVSRTLWQLGDVQLALGQVEAALRSDRQALANAERTLGPQHFYCAEAMTAIGNVYLRTHKLDEALSYFERAKTVYDKSKDPAARPESVSTLLGIGQVYLTRQRPANALPMLEQAVSIRKDEPADGAELGQARFLFAQALWATGERKRAHELATAAAMADSKSSAPLHKTVAEAAQWLRRHATQD
jgi:serine/threonine protein kinase/tetratricopeptide (TPR) repeat protein